MRVRLTKDIPVEKKHGMIQGREFIVLSVKEGNGRGQNGVWVMGDTGEEILLLVLRKEFEEI